MVGSPDVPIMPRWSERLEGERLAVVGQRRLDLGDRRAGAGGHHHFGRIVGDDAGQAGGAERGRIGGQGIAEPGPGAAAGHGERRRPCPA